MNSKERTLKAIGLDIPDRVPIFVDMVPELAEKFSRKYNMSGNKLLTSMGNDLAVCSFGVASSFGAMNDGEVDDWGIKWKKIKYGRGFYNEIAEKPLENSTIDDLKSLKIPDAAEESRYEEIADLVSEFGKEFAIMIDMSCTIFELSWYMRGMDKLLIDMVQNSRFVDTLMDRILEFYIPAGKKIAGMGADIIWTGDDLGMQAGMLMSPEMFRRFIKERYRLLIREIKKSNKNIKIAFHSDGYITPIIEDLIEVGVDILNPVQPKSMNPKEIKDKFGGHLCFMGTIDEQEVLPFGNIEDLRNEIDTRLETVGFNGGLIIGPTHNIQIDTSMEKVEFLFSHIKEKGKYPILK
ncbi:MAG: uroporphyrinogen decarboxylase family protein [Candidatus Humimicrobiaceae bacterium]